MPLFTFTCQKCGLTFDYIECIAKRNDTQHCIGCNGPAVRNVAAELVGTGNVDETCQEHVRYSKAMGVNPNQIIEAERNFPGSEYVKSGPLTGDLIIRSRKHKLREMRRRGMEEFA